MMSRQSQDPSNQTEIKRSANMLTLLVVDDTGAEQAVAVDRFPFRIGKKAKANDLVFDRRNISRAHCVIAEKHGALLLRDLKSRNGTFLNGQRVEGTAPLPDGGVIRLGGFTITCRVGSAEPGGKSALRRTPVALKKKLHEQILATLDLKHTDLSDKSQEEVREKAVAAARAAALTLEAERPSWLSAAELVKEVVDEAVGLGPIEDLLADDTVDEIMVNGWDKIYVERAGKISLSAKQFTGNEQVLAVIRRILAPIGRRIDESSPMVDARLPNGSRVNAIIPPLSLTGPIITIRKFARTPYTHENLIRFDSISAEMVEFLRMAVLYRQNICISGGTGSGKTTLLNILSSFIPETERIVTIEDAAELQLQQEHVVSLEAKPPSIEGRGAIPIRKLVINSLRMRPDRIIIGECRGGEALDMLQAMNTGHDGSLTTLHANSPHDVLSRLETMVLMAGLELPSRAIREQISAAINLIVHGERLPDGTRKVVSISEITGMEGDTITLQTIFEYHRTGFDDNGKILGELRATGMVPKFVHELKERGTEVDMDLFRTAGNTP